MSNEPAPSPWSPPVWTGDAELPTTVPPTEATSPGNVEPGAEPAATANEPLVGPPDRPQTPTRGRIAGLLAAAMLVGGVSGGVAGLAGVQLLGAGRPTSSATQTQVVQADSDNPDWTAVAAAASRAVVAIDVVAANGSQGQGSGVVIDAQGYIVTNNHVVASSGSRASITVVLGDASYATTVVGTDPTTDLAVLQIVEAPAELEVMAYADSSELAVGDPVMAIGNPLGLADTVTTGIVSALNRPVITEAVTTSPTAGQGDAVVTAAIQTNAAINPGNSGGALVNASGELVGITSAIATLASSSTDQTGNIGIGFAIASNQVRYVVDQLIANGYADHPQIGVSASDTTGPGLLGAEVTKVVSGSPAEQAGLKVGDLITAVNGDQVTSTESLVALVRAGEVGKELKLTIVRAGSPQVVAVTPVAAPRRNG